MRFEKIESADGFVSVRSKIQRVRIGGEHERRKLIAGRIHWLWQRLRRDPVIRGCAGAFGIPNIGSAIATMTVAHEINMSSRDIERGLAIELPLSIERCKCVNIRKRDLIAIDIYCCRKEIIIVRIVIRRFGRKIKKTIGLRIESGSHWKRYIS